MFGTNPRSTPPSCENPTAGLEWRTMALVVEAEDGGATMEDATTSVMVCR
jgi:hypothetical protein